MSIKWCLSPSATSWHDYWQGISVKSQLKSVDDSYPRFLEITLKYAHGQGIIFDGGCGLGRWVLYFKNRGYQAVGLDFTFEAIQQCRQYNGQTPLILGSVDALPIKSDRVYLYLSMGVIEHFEEGPWEPLREAHRVIRPGGHIIVSIPYQNFYRSTLRRFVVMPLLKLFKPRYRNRNRIFYQYYYSKRDLRRFLRKTGFEVKETFYHDLFHTRNDRIGISLEFPFLRKNAGKSAGKESGVSWELKSAGVWLARMAEFFSKGIFASHIVCVARVKK